MSRYLIDLTSAGLFASLNTQQVRGLKLDADAGSRAAAASESEDPSLHVHGERDFGIGYGNSSGYGTDRHYVSDWMPQRFRCS